jgi:PIN domain nuclease of toxin-antitoxin system
MSDRLLLDTHALLWLENGLPLRAGALRSIADAAEAGSLFASHISIRELGVALGKTRFEQRPNLRGLPPDKWIRQTSSAFGIRLLSISLSIASEAGMVPAV